MSALGDLVQRGNLDDLVREVDARCNRGDYEQVLALRDASLRAGEELGRQLWGPAQYAEYRLALEAPGELAATVVTPGAARFALGPLTEVIAQHHTFDEVADHLAVGVRATVAQERALRGEDLTGDPRCDAEEVGVPAALQPWEPGYLLPTYRAADRHEPEPPWEVTSPASVAAVTGASSAPAADRAASQVAPGKVPTETDIVDPGLRPGLDEALRDLVASWRDESRGELRVAVVAGEVSRAVGAVNPTATDPERLRLPDAMARMAWAGASGGFHGRRRGGAAGRAAAWWVAHRATGLAFPAEPDELEYELEELDWYAFGTPTSGWQLRLVVSGADWSAAIDARDHHEEDDHGR